MKPSPLVLAIDAGTSSTRVLAFDENGRVVAPIAQRTYAQTTTPDGGVQCDADELLHLTFQCLEEVVKNLQGREVRAVAMSCFWHSLMGVNENGEAATPLYSWADNRAAAQVEKLRAMFDENTIHARTGCVFHASYWTAKLLWLRGVRPELFDGKTRFVSFGEYLMQKACGAARVSLSMASGTGLFHQNNADWDDEILEKLSLSRALFSPLCDTADFQNSQLFPALKNARWFPALGDGACSNVGSGCTEIKENAARIALNVGTSGALRVVVPEYSGAPPRGLFKYKLDARRSLIGGPLSNAGNALLWTRQTFALNAESEARIAAMTPNAHGLTVLPFLVGERAPSWNAQARFALHGATLDSTSEDMARAVLEGVSLRFLLVLERLQNALQNEMPSTQNAFEVVVSGGALQHSQAWPAIMTDCLGVPLLESRENEASARGAALMALEALGIISDIAELPAAIGETRTPNLEHHAIYRRALSTQEAFYAATPEYSAIIS